MGWAGSVAAAAFAREPFWVGGVCGVEHAGALLAGDGGGAVLHAGGNVRAQPIMPMLGVVPAEEGLAVPTGGLDRVEPVGEIGPILQCLELRLAARVVGRDVGARGRMGEAAGRGE